MEKSISVIIPVYNAEKTIEVTLRSILNQSYQNYEIIVVNDGSLDKSGEICQKYANQYKCIKYFDNENHGVSFTRNFGISKATGDYIMFLDSDDEYKDKIFDKINHQLIDTDFDWIVFGYERIHVEKSNKVKMMRTDEFKLDNEINKKIFIERLQNHFLFNQIWNKVYKKKLILDNDIRFDESIHSGEDYIFNIKYLKKVEKAQYIDEILYKYYTKQNGLSLKDNEEKIYVKLRNLNEHKKFYLEEGYDIEYIDKSYVNICFSGITGMVDIDDKKRAYENIKKYIDNSEIRKDLLEIKKRTNNVKLKMLISILLIKNYVLLEKIAKFLIFVRKIYRKIRLG